VTEPNSKNVAIYEDFYETYRSLYKTLKFTFSTQTNIVKNGCEKSNLILIDYFIDQEEIKTVQIK